MNQQLLALTEDCSDTLANLSNTAALLWQEMQEINWVGFYVLRDNSLILGPFQGKPACTVIPVGSGVCGRAVEENQIQRISNVHAFPGHIACDSASNSEIVLPVYKEGRIWGVLDIDSPVLNRFSPEDERELRASADIISSFLDRCRAGAIDRTV